MEVIDDEEEDGVEDIALEVESEGAPLLEANNKPCWGHCGREVASSPSCSVRNGGKLFSCFIILTLFCPSSALLLLSPLIVSFYFNRTQFQRYPQTAILKNCTMLKIAAFKNKF